MSWSLDFGEVNIPSSRAFWDDCDEDELSTIEEPEKLKLQITSISDMEEAIAQAKVVLIIEGTDISKFAANVLLKQAKKLATIPSKRSAIYYLDNKEAFLVIVDEDLSTSGEILELLTDIIKTENTFTLTIKPKIDYKTEDLNEVREENTFLRSIGQFSASNNVKKLEAPNFISGVAAGVACWRHNMGLHVESYVAYTDNIYLDIVAAKPIIKLLENLGLECCHNYNTKSFQDSSHLYI